MLGSLINVLIIYLVGLTVYLIGSPIHLVNQIALIFFCVCVLLSQLISITPANSAACNGALVPTIRIDHNIPLGIQRVLLEHERGHARFRSSLQIILFNSFVFYLAAGSATQNVKYVPVLIIAHWVLVLVNELIADAHIIDPSGRGIFMWWLSKRSNTVINKIRMRVLRWSR